MQLSLILRSLRQPHQFILCGDSNQIVHPNFFSWSNVKSLFYKQDLKGRLTRILYANYPDHVMPAYRKRRPYLSGILSKNEIYRKDPYNRQIFYRIKHGYYIINPLLEIEYRGEWQNIYDVTGVSKLEHTGDPNTRYFAKYVRETRERLAPVESKEPE